MARILVVDDEPDERFLVGRVLTREGHEVTVASNGAAALKAVKERPPDLVVTDIMMPVMDGLELIRRLRGDPLTAPIPILAASGDTHLAGSADAVLSKPYGNQQLVEIVSGLLEKGGGC
jgi:CheY-like chemotaxis protein